MSETLRRKYASLYAKRLNEKKMAGCQYPGPNSAYEKLKRASKQHHRVESMYFDDGSYWKVSTPSKKAKKALFDGA